MWNGPERKTEKKSNCDFELLDATTGQYWRANVHCNWLGHRGGKCFLYDVHDPEWHGNQGFEKSFKTNWRQSMTWLPLSCSPRLTGKTTKNFGFTKILTKTALLLPKQCFWARWFTRGCFFTRFMFFGNLPLGAGCRMFMADRTIVRSGASYPFHSGLRQRQAVTNDVAFSTWGRGGDSIQ